jgi:hypothetical protein
MPSGSKVAGLGSPPQEFDPAPTSQSQRGRASHSGRHRCVSSPRCKAWQMHRAGRRVKVYKKFGSLNRHKNPGLARFCKPSQVDPFSAPTRPPQKRAAARAAAQPAPAAQVRGSADTYERRLLTARVLPSCLDPLCVTAHAHAHIVLDAFEACEQDRCQVSEAAGVRLGVRPDHARCAYWHPTRPPAPGWWPWH